MRLSKHQRSTIKKIYNGEIYDIVSYLKCFEFGSLVKYDENEISQNFQTDAIAKTYYWNNKLKRNKANTLTEQEYLRKVEQEELHSEYYDSDSLRIEFTGKDQRVEWNGSEYTFDFYSGVYVAKSVEHILDFLALCQYLKAEMLILEVPCSPDREALGLFFEKECNDSVENTESREPPIHYETLTVDDTYYLRDRKYAFSNINCTICSDYIGKKIYPTPRLKLFIGHHFKTAAERAQSAALWAAWIAILVSLITNIIPHLRDQTDEQLASLSRDINNIKACVEEMARKPEFNLDLSPVLEKTDTAISLLEQINETLLDEPPASEGETEELLVLP